VWTLAAWDEKRDDFRTFRLDRIEMLEITSRNFTQKRGQRLEDMMKKARAEAATAPTPSPPGSASG
jgi:predicted DNA-binding transcriptional regulator YafY